MKLGERGTVSVDSTGKKIEKVMINQKHSALPSFANNIVDTNGTGDALLAYASLSLAKTKSLFISSIIGSLAAAIECEKDGNVAITTDEIIKKINSIKNLASYKSSRKYK